MLHRGGHSSTVAMQLSSGVSVIYSTGNGAFAALKVDGSVVTWYSYLSMSISMIVLILMTKTCYSMKYMYL